MLWFHRLGSWVTPLKVTVPCWSPKLEPLILTWVSTGPESGSSLEMVGTPAVTSKVTPLLDSPSTVTTTGPSVAVDGTTAWIFLSFQPFVDAAVPLNVTLPDVPKLEPLILISVPTGAESGSNLEMFGPVGALVTVKVTPALDCPPAVVTTTSPVVAPSGTLA